MELVPIPAILRRRQVLRPILSARGEQRVVTKTLRTEKAMVRGPAPVGRRVERSETEYMITEFMPVNCWAAMTATTAMMAGR